MERTVNKYAPLAGVLFPIFAVAGIAIGGSMPSTDDPASEVVAHFADTADQVKVGTMVGAIAAILVVVFAARVAGSMRSAGSRLLATIAIGGGVVAAAGAGVDSALRFALADSAGDISPEATQAIFALWSGFFWPMHLGFAAVALAAGLCALESKFLPSWLAWLGIVGSVVVLVPVMPVVIVGLAMQVLWSVITAVVLFRRPVDEMAAA
jgi:hypothetical protein